MSDPRTPDPRNSDPAYEDRPTLRSSYSDPDPDPVNGPLTHDPLLEERPIDTRGRGGWVMIGVLAVLAVIAVIALSSGMTTDPGTTAVIPEQSQQTMPEATPQQPAPLPAE